MYRAFFCVAIDIVAMATGAFTNMPHHGEFLSDYVVGEQSLPLLDQRSAFLWNRAVLRISTGNIIAAEKDFLDLLMLTPDFFPSTNTPPKIMTPFLRARLQFLSQQKTRDRFNVSIMSEIAEDGVMSLDILMDEEFMVLVTEIVVYVKTRSQSAFRSMSFLSPVPPATKQRIEFSYPITPHDHLDYFIDFIGHFRVPFYTIGSSSFPRFLTVKQSKPISNLTLHPANAITQLKAGWPILLSVTLTIVGALTYGLLKLDR